MNREDEIIRESLKLDISAPDEINRKVLQSVAPKKRERSFLRVAATIAACFIAIMGTAAIVNAATGGKIAEYLREKLEKWTYVFGNGSKTTKEIVYEDDQEIERITFVEDNVVMEMPISKDEKTYWMVLKVKREDGGGTFMSLDVSVDKDAPDEELYYWIRGKFFDQVGRHQDPYEKAQILTGLREAAQNAEVKAVRDALTDVADDYENNRKIYYAYWPGRCFNDDEDIFLIADVTDLPNGEVAIIVDPAKPGQKSWICSFENSDDRVTGFMDLYSAFYSEEACQELSGRGVPIFDMREAE